MIITKQLVGVSPILFDHQKDGEHCLRFSLQDSLADKAVPGKQVRPRTLVEIGCYPLREADVHLPTPSSAQELGLDMVIVRIHA